MPGLRAFRYSRSAKTKSTAVSIPTKAPSRKSWRDVLPIHPAAELFPRMSDDELRALGEDIKKNGLQQAVVLLRENGCECLLDGIGRLDAFEAVGVNLVKNGKLNLSNVRLIIDDIDPYAFVISANIHRRHLTAEQRRALIAKLLKATPEKSDRQIAETVKASPTTVGSVRAEMESTVQVGQLDQRVGKDGKARKQPSRKTSERKSREEKAAYEAGKLLGALEIVSEAVQRDFIQNLPAEMLAERDDIGSASTGEAARKDAEIEELRNAKRRLEIENTGLRSEVEELRTANAALRKSLEEASAKFVELSGQFDELRHRMGQAAPPPADDGLDIPASLRRSAQ